MDQKKILLEKLKNIKEKHIFIIIIATKPDIIKQAPFYKELKNRKQNVVLVHTGQHYDFNLSGGMLEEFDMKVDYNLGISGTLCQKTAQIIERFGNLLEEIKKIDKNPIPIVHGDTTTASAVANASWASQFSVVHNEAGIRTLTPKKHFFKELIENQDVSKWIEIMKNQKNFEKGSTEPNPEQFNTRATEPATGVYLAPHKITKGFLEDEGYPSERIFVTGNSVVDALQNSIKESKSSKIFEKYPLLKNPFIRFCIHRRENCLNKKRFIAIFEAMEKVVNSGSTVLLISLFVTNQAIENFGLKSRLEKLKQNTNFIYSEVWPFYSDVIAAMKNSSVCVTDSGSMQEEMNEMGIPCVTLRFGTDRSETLFSGGNVLAPPIDSNIILKIIKEIEQKKLLKNSPKIYGNNPSKKGVDSILSILDKYDDIGITEEIRIFSN